jgi:C-terminal processing protease CtpA/Prc
MSVQAQIVDLLRDLQRRHGLAYLPPAYTADVGLDATQFRLLSRETHSSYPGIGVSVLPTNAGLDVVATEPGPAESAGIRKGDVIVAINGIKLNDDESLQRALDTIRIGTTARLSQKGEARKIVHSASVGEESHPTATISGRLRISRPDSCEDWL